MDIHNSTRFTSTARVLSSNPTRQESHEHVINSHFHQIHISWHESITCDSCQVGTKNSYRQYNIADQAMLESGNGFQLGKSQGTPSPCIKHWPCQKKCDIAYTDLFVLVCISLLVSRWLFSWECSPTADVMQIWLFIQLVVISSGVHKQCTKSYILLLLRSTHF